ncbi:Flp pilus assembly protein CpaB, partial [Caulobacter sp. 17J65-9]|uniref:Flp pilus assembly protein CpaB n=1 Tax=Caulobacter sp. 17J65-9 TaxID=2709382 RepID=UPI0013C9DACC
MRAIGLGLLAVALVLGLAAVWGVRTITAAKSAPATQLDQTVVVVASRPIEFGETLKPELLRAQAWPAGAQPDGAFKTVGELTTGSPRVALRPIAANEPILASRISGPGARATLSGAIDAGKRAVTIRVDDVVGVAGFVLPGDFVDVLVTRTEGDRGERTNMRTDVLLEGVRVLAVDQLANENKNDPVVAKAATIEVAPEQAQRLALAAEVGTLSLSLRGTADAMATSPSEAVRTVRVGDLRLGAAAAPEPVKVVRVQQPR